MTLLRRLSIPAIAALTAAPLAVTGAASASGDAPPELVLGAASAAAQSAENARGVQDPVAKGRSVVRLDARALESGTVAIDLGDRHVVAERTRATTKTSGSKVWSGRISGTQDDVTFVRRGSEVTASVQLGERLFRIAPGAQGSHVLTEVDLAAMPAEHPDTLPDGGGKNLTARKPAPTTPTGTTANTVIRVLVVASAQAAAQNGGSAQAIAEQAVAETNTGYANSNIPITMELAGYRNSGYSETGNFSTDLDRFRGTNDGYLDDMHAVRDQVGADVNVLLTTGTAYCGIGYLNSTAATAFSVVATSCATGYYSFGHEIGHNQGAEHDPANSGTAGYAHGYQYPAGKWRTIMAYNCTSGCTRLNYWSNPRITYGGVPMGTTTTNDNARKLTERAATVGAFR